VTNVTDAGDVSGRLAAQEQEIARLQRLLREQAVTFEQLLRATSVLNATLNLSELLHLIVTAAAQLLKAETSSIILADEATGDLRFEASADLSPAAMVVHPIPAGRGIAGWVVQHGQPLVVDDPGRDARFYDRIDRVSGRETRNLLAVPLCARGRVLGVVEVINTLASPGFDQRDVALAQSLASQASVAIDNARMYARLTEAVVTARLSYRL